MTLAREWMRGAAPLAVLTLLERDEMYGYQLVEALEKDSGGLLAMGQSTVYPLLYNLKARGHVKAAHRSSPTGRQRKYYQLTDEGLRWLEGQRSQWRTLVADERRPCHERKERPAYASTRDHGDCRQGPRCFWTRFRRRTC